MRLSILVVTLSLSGCSLLGSPSLEDRLQERLRALDTFHDFEIARAASGSALLDLEGLHRLEPENQALMLELVRAWVLHTELFSVDALEAAQLGGDRAEVLYQESRVATGYTRASFWAREWLERRAPGLRLEAPDAELRSALDTEFSEVSEAASLLWVGHALLGVTLTASGHDREYGSATRAFLERAVELDASAHFASAHALLGLYQSRRPEPNLEESRKHFSRAEALAGPNYLLNQLYRAIGYECARGDRARLEVTLDEILKTRDPNPAVRLENTTAKRRARRWSTHRELWAECEQSTKAR